MEKILVKQVLSAYDKLVDITYCKIIVRKSPLEKKVVEEEEDEYPGLDFEEAASK